MKQTRWLMMALMAATTITASAAYTLTRVSVHDPSVVWDHTMSRYYLFGSHRGVAWSKDMMNWQTATVNWRTPATNPASNEAAFTTNQTKTISKGGETVDFGNFDAYAWSAAIKTSGSSTWSIDGNMWAPDVIYNPTMKKWCMYLSINGFKWNSSIILLTAPAANGPYTYQGPVIFSGFNVTSNTGTSYKKTDLELVLGTQSSLPSRYSVGERWGSRWPHCIDPCVFYDEEGKLWMSYGSWSGGIWIIELDEETGLRDYNVTYPSTGGSTDGVTSDPYFGKKISGGFYSSGEGSYIEYIGGYYFLFVSNGGLMAGGVQDDYNNGGYQMRVFRSDKPNGPYRDPSGRNAVLTQYELNFGPNSSTRGANIFGAYTEWGNQAVGNYGERSQGHNSIMAAQDGRTYLVYHTRFQNRGEGHEVRVHQVFQNEDGWLVAAPFEYTGETVKSDDIATTQQIATEKIPGVYKFLLHKYGLDHRTKEAATPVEIQLNADGTITGSYTGSWQTVSGTSYVTLTINNIQYKGVMVEQTLEKKTTKAASFTAMSKSGVSVWGYRTADLPSGIRSVTLQDASRQGTFDLQGRRIDGGQKGRLGKGVYIRNGRKYVE